MTKEQLKKEWENRKKCYKEGLLDMLFDLLLEIREEQKDNQLKGE